MSSTSIYCTYITSYSGNKLPPFYIGSSTTQKIEAGYRGSVSSKKYKNIWITELNENPHLFKTKIISHHNTKSESLIKEKFLQKSLNVVKSSMYINMCFAMKEFDSTRKEIAEAIGAGNRGKIRSEKFKQDIRLRQTGVIRGPNKNKTVYPIRTCNYCNFVGAGPAMTNNHFNNCKSINPGKSKSKCSSENLETYKKLGTVLSNYVNKSNYSVLSLSDSEITAIIESYKEKINSSTKTASVENITILNRIFKFSKTGTGYMHRWTKEKLCRVHKELVSKIPGTDLIRFI